MKLLVTGSQDWGDARSRRLGRGRANVWVPLDRLRLKYGSPESPLLVVNGKCPKGLDALVSEWTEEYKGQGVEEIPFPADWDRHGNGAGFIRNGEMVRTRPDMVMAWANPCRKRKPWCPPGEHPSHGTADCVKQARDAKIPVHFCPNGLKW